MSVKDPSAKAIVFSQFVNMLDIIEYRVKLEMFDCARLQGGMSISDRDKSLKRFRSDPSCRVCVSHIVYVEMMTPPG